MKMVLNHDSNRPTFASLDYASSGVQVCVIDHSGSVNFNQNCRNDWIRIWGASQLHSNSCYYNELYSASSSSLRI
jgi:hypothetical protein